MPRTHAHLPLSSSPADHHHRHDDEDLYSKSNEKPKKSLQTLYRNGGSLVSLVCFLFGIAGIVFSVFAFLRGKTVPVFRCGRSEDTFRSFYSLASSWRIGGRDDAGAGAGAGTDTGTGTVTDRPKFLGLVGIQTGFSSVDRRKALRSTWFPSDPESLLRLEQATGLTFRFVIGKSKVPKMMAELDKEIEKYKDFMIIDHEEEYSKLPHKTLAFFKAAYELFEADYYVKADDDIYLRPDRLATLLAKERAHPFTYIGCMKKGPVITDPKSKWFEKSGYLIGREYFSHAYGPIYILSAEVVASLAMTRNNSLRMFSNEDVTIGSWMLAMNVQYEYNRAICDPRCTPTSIAVWDLPKCSGLCNPVMRMKELHKVPMCSKSPTLPPDDR